MTRNILCAVYLLIAISAVHSASYYYRAGREVIVPTIEEVKEVISELKKDEPVIVEEIVAAVPAEAVEPVVKNVPVVENVVPIVEAVENNVVADAEKVVVNDVVSDEARSKPNPAIRLDTLEVIQPAGEKSDKVITVAETVKNAAVQAIEKQNQEVAESIKVEEPVVVPETKVVDTPVVKSALPVVEQVVQPVVAEPVAQPVVETVVQPVVETVDTSAVKSVEPVVKVENVVPAVEAEVVKESVRSADPEPSKPEEPAKEEIAKEEPAKEEPAKEEIAKEEPAKEEKVVAPETRQQTPSPAGALEQLQSTFNAFTTTVQHSIQNLVQGNLPFINNANRPQQQSDTALTGEVPASEQAPNSAVAADAPQAAAVSPTTAAPNLLQSVQQAITQFTNNIIPAQLRPTTAPTAADPPVIVSGSRGSEETVEVVQTIEVDNAVNDKVDLEQKPQ